MIKSIVEVKNKIPNSVLTGNLDVKVSGLTSDSRRVKPGDIFVCIEGLTVDGHKYIDKAIELGATAIIVSKDVNVKENIAVITVEDTREAMLFVAPYIYDYPANKMRMIGVTGTNGKTTTTHIIAHILEEQGYKVGVIGTVHLLINGKSYPIHNTTPDAGDLQPMLHQMVEEGVEFCIMEVSSHALALNRVSGVEFDNAVFTNLTQDHLDFHKTFENYLEAKAKLFEQVSRKNQTKENKGAVINLDDQYGKAIMEYVSATCKTYGIGINGVPTLEAKDICISSKNTEYTLTVNGEKYKVETGTTGLFNVYNTLAAVGSCLIENIDIKNIIKSLATFKAVPGRFELIEEGQDYAVVVDYAHSPDGLENILRTAKGIAENDIIVVFGCGGDRDKSKRPIMGEIAARYANKVIITSDNPRSEEPQNIIDDIIVGVRQGIQQGNTFDVEFDREKAIKKAIKVAQKGDIVLIAGKGHEDYQILKDETIYFDDRKIARKALKERD